MLQSKGGHSVAGNENPLRCLFPVPSWGCCSWFAEGKWVLLQSLSLEINNSLCSPVQLPKCLLPSRQLFKGSLCRKRSYWKQKRQIVCFSDTKKQWVIEQELEDLESSHSHPWPVQETHLTFLIYLDIQLQNEVGQEEELIFLNVSSVLQAPYIISTPWWSMKVFQKVHFGAHEMLKLFM